VLDSAVVVRSSRQGANCRKTDEHFAMVEIVLQARWTASVREFFFTVHPGVHQELFESFASPKRLCAGTLIA
jgi:hypothetical protein